MKAIKWGIIGCGSIAKAEIAPAMQRAPHCQLVAVVDQRQERSAAFVEKYGAQRAYDRLDDFLDDPEVEAVYIGTPAVAHCAHVRQAAAKGKHILCEKPMAMNSAECQQMIAACQQAGVKLMIGFMMRFNVFNQQARQLIQAGALGQIVYTRVQASYYYFDGLAPANDWRLDPAIAGGGPLIDMGSHGLDLMRYFHGEIVEVSAGVDNIVDHYPVEDCAFALVKFAGGGYGILDACFNLKWPERKIDIYGSQGSLFLEGTLGRASGGKLRVRIEENEEEYAPPAINNIYESELEHFGQVIRGAAAPLLPGEEGLKNMRIIEAIYRAGREKKVVKVPA